MELPKEFVAYTERLMGLERYRRFEEAMSGSSVSFVRPNPYKLHDGVIEGEHDVKWYDAAVSFGLRPPFTFDPLFHAGLYYVQESSSMFLAHVLRQLVHEPVSMLDMCAAPGGKSTLSRSVLPEGSLLFCNEPNRNRARVLLENTNKWGHPDVVVTSNYPRDIRRSGLHFDVVLCDVPCSGEGMFRKDPDSIEEWSTSHVEECWRLQREIVSDAWEVLKPGGYLVYSTCTYNVSENEENVRWMTEQFNAEPVAVTTGQDWNIQPSLLDGFKAPVYRFIPGFTGGEGLFMAVLHKQGNTSCQKKAPKRKQVGRATFDWLCTDRSYVRKQVADEIWAIPETLFELYDIAQRSLTVLSAGVNIGTQKGKNLIPSQALALSICLEKKAFPRVALDYQQAIRFLRRDAVVLPQDTPKGYVLVCYRQQPIGFVKNLGDRANNLYPSEWRVRSTHVPDRDAEIVKYKNN